MSEEVSNECMYYDRIVAIQAVMAEYGEENFALSFSGGKDSSVVSALLDAALPGNKIPRVYCDTGIEYKKMVEHVNHLKKSDDRIIIVKPEIPVIPFFKQYGYPFKSKTFSQAWWGYHHGKRGWIQKYLDHEYKGWDRQCPQALMYLFDDTIPPPIDFQISDYCCTYRKEKPINTWMKTHRIPYTITGVRAAEGGRRQNAQCRAYRNGRFKKFNPLAPCSDEFIDYCVEKLNVDICELYYPPYNFLRTGCKGCPFALELESELGILKELDEAEYNHCEYLWKPVYEEYRRIGYRLPKKIDWSMPIN